MNKFSLINKWATHTSTGIVSKGIYKDDSGNLYLAKGNSENGTYEPYSEALVSILFKLLKIPDEDFVTYTIENGNDFPEVKIFNIQHVCLCKRLDKPIVQFANYIDNSSEKYVYDYFQAYRNTKDLSMEWLFRMLLLDAFVGNRDRHLNNFDIIQYEQDYFINAPMLDFGASLLYNLEEHELREYTGNEIGPDSAKPFKETHERQIHYLQRYVKDYKPFQNINKGDFFNSFEQESKEIFKHLSDIREKAIKSYLYQRWDKYIKPFMSDDNKIQQQSDNETDTNCTVGW